MQNDQNYTAASVYLGISCNSKEDVFHTDTLNSLLDEIEKRLNEYRGMCNGRFVSG